MLIALAILGCSSSAPATRCTDDAAPLAEGLTCGEAKAPSRYLRVLAGKPLPAGTTAAALAEVGKRHADDPATTRSWLADLAERGRTIEQATGLAGAEARSHGLWELVEGRGPITREHGELWNLVPRVVSIRGKDDQEELVLTERDIDGWIRFASLAHEIHGGRPLTVSIAEQGAVHDLAVRRFEQADRAEQVAMVGFGAVWPEVVKAWKAAPYTQQQQFIQRARIPAADADPLPWIEQILEGDVVTNAHALHDTLGPFHFRDGDGYFGKAP